MQWAILGFLAVLWASPAWALSDDDCAFAPTQTDPPWAPLGVALLILGARRRRSPR